MQSIFDGLSYVNPLNLMGKSGSGAPAPLLNGATLTPTQRGALSALQAEFPNCDPGALLGYLKVRNWKVAEAAAQRHSTLHWAPSMRPTMHDIAPFLLGPPDGCIVLLEDRQGGCARDRLGRPIVASIGMLHGSLLDMQRQMVYALRRAELYYTDKAQIQSNCVVIEVLPRPGAVATFRFPDANTKLLMEMQKTHFPGTLSSTTHFCGIPTAITWAFALCKPFMEAEAYNNMVLKPDYSHLPSHIDPASLLVEWGGQLRFDLAEYVAWRLSEEGAGADASASSAVAVKGADADAAASSVGDAPAGSDDAGAPASDDDARVGAVPAPASPPGADTTAEVDALSSSLAAASLASAPAPTPTPAPKPTPAPTPNFAPTHTHTQHLLSAYPPRRYDPNQKDDSVATMEQAFLHTPASVLHPQAVLSATLGKRGNGQGFFSSYKWKEKLVVLLPMGVLVYFDKVAVAEDNLPSKVVALGGGVYVETDGADSNNNSGGGGGGSSKPFQFTIVTPSRNYTFAAESDAQRKQWASTIAEMVKATQAATRG